MKRTWGSDTPENGPDVVELMYPEDRKMLADHIYDVIKHGDDEHKQWLRDKVDEIFRVV